MDPVKYISSQDGQSFLTCSLNVSVFFLWWLYFNVTFSLSHNIGKQHTEQDMRRWLYIAFTVHWFSYRAVAVPVWAVCFNHCTACPVADIIPTVMQACSRSGRCAFRARVSLATHKQANI